jgi:signal transduction histidine kinase
MPNLISALLGYADLAPQHLRLVNAALVAEIEHERSERQKAEAMLRAVEHRQVERLVALTPESVIVVGTDGVVQFANEAALKLFDKDREQFLGSRFGFAVKAGEILQIGIPRRGEQRIGELRVVDCEWSGRPAYLVVVLDISERKRVERLKDEFVATVSHELRTPLTSIAGSLGLLAGGAVDKLPDSALRLITIAHSNCQRLVRLVNDILDIETIESGAIAFDVARIDVRGLVEQVVEANQMNAEEQGVRLRLDAAATAVEVEADPDRLAQALTNLLSNAIKFSAPRQEVTVAVEDTGAAARISVQNRGAGIPEAFKSRVFEKFAQADSSDARTKGGTGLGLSIVKQIVTRLGGEVAFEEAPGGGTVFHVELPRLFPSGAG